MCRYLIAVLDVLYKILSLFDWRFNIAIQGKTVVVIADKRCCIRMEVPKVDAMFIGTGDLFAALWLAWSSVHSSDIQVNSFRQKT